MALNISGGTLTIQGTSITGTSVYSRLEIALAPSGKNMQVSSLIYGAKSNYSAGDSIVRINELNTTLFNFEVDVDGGESQTLLLAHQKVETQLEADGYSVVIVDL